MKVIGILLIIVGVIGILMGLMMFGDIGIACIVGALAALLSGIGFLIADKRIQFTEGGALHISNRVPDDLGKGDIYGMLPDNYSSGLRNGVGSDLLCRRSFGT